MVDRQPLPIIRHRTRACGGIGRRARLRALWRESSVGVRVSLGALKVPASRHFYRPSTSWVERVAKPSGNTWPFAQAGGWVESPRITVLDQGKVAANSARRVTGRAGGSRQWAGQ